MNSLIVPFMLLLVCAQALGGELALLPVSPARAGGVTLTLTPTTAAVGETVTVRASASDAGRLSLWNFGSSGRVQQIFLGKGQAAIERRLRVGGPPGVESVVALWTRDDLPQPDSTRFESADDWWYATQQVVKAPPTDWDTAHVELHVSGTHPEARNDDPPVERAPTISHPDGDVYLLAVGANTGDLRYADADARRFAAFMRSAFALPDDRVQLLTNANRHDFLEALKRLSSRARAGDTAVIYFSGHGTTVPDLDGDEADGLDEAFVTTDVNGQERPGLGDVLVDDDFDAAVARLRGVRVLLFLDACFGRGLSRTLRADVLNAKLKYLPLMDSRAASTASTTSGTVLDPGDDEERELVAFAAAEENQIALEDVQGGLFTQTLLAQLQQRAGSDLAQVFSATRAAVLDRARGVQAPALWGQVQLAGQYRLESMTRSAGDWVQRPGLPGQGLARNVFGHDDRLEVASTQYPWSAIGTLQNIGCTVTLVSADLAVTAAHCVVDPETRALRSNLTNFLPNLIHGQVQEAVRITRVWWGTTDPDTDRYRDWAIVRLEKPVGNRYGWMGVRPLNLAQFAWYRVNMAGYSGDFRGGDTATAHLGCAILNTRAGNGMLYHACEGTRGSSGAAMFETPLPNQPYIVAMNVAEAREGGEVSLHPAQYSERFTNIAIGIQELSATLQRIAVGAQ